jgi:hypothetical protein
MLQLLINILVRAGTTDTNGNDETTCGAPKIYIFIQSISLSCCMEIPFCSKPTGRVAFLDEVQVLFHLPGGSLGQQEVGARWDSAEILTGYRPAFRSYTKRNHTFQPVSLAILFLTSELMQSRT